MDRNSYWTTQTLWWLSMISWGIRLAFKGQSECATRSLGIIKSSSLGLFWIDFVCFFDWKGGCGVCTVILNFTDALGRDRSVSVNSCLRPIATVDGMSITTIEGVGNTVNGLDPVQVFNTKNSFSLLRYLFQNSMVTNNASQCGMCSPGFVMQVQNSQIYFVLGSYIFLRWRICSPIILLPHAKMWKLISMVIFADALDIAPSSTLFNLLRRSMWILNICIIFKWTFR